MRDYKRYQALRIRFNHCSRFINQTIFHLQYDFPVATIDVLLGDISPKKIVRVNKFPQKNPFFFTSEFNEYPEFEPHLIKFGRNHRLRVIRDNNLFFNCIYKDGKIIEKNVSKTKIPYSNRVTVPRATRLIVDKNNKRVKLVGFKTSSEWVKVDNINPKMKDI